MCPIKKGIINLKLETMKAKILTIVILFSVLFSFAQNKTEEKKPVPFYKSDWKFIKQNGKYGFINSIGEVVVKPKFDTIYKFGIYKSDWALIKANQKYGFINEIGKFVVLPRYDTIYKFGTYRSDWALVKQDGKYGFINEIGEIVLKPKYDNIDSVTSKTQKQEEYIPAKFSNLENINDIIAIGNIKILIEQDTTECLISESNAWNYSFTNGTLSLYGFTCISNNNSNGKCDVVVKLKKINKIMTSGNSEVKSKSKIKANYLTLISSGNSDISMNLDAQRTIVETTGNSTIKLKGNCDDLNLSTSGNSDFIGITLESKKCNAKISGNSTAKVHAINEIDLSASGNSDFVYYGNPSIINKNISGHSEIKNISKDSLNNKDVSIDTIFNSNKNINWNSNDNKHKSNNKISAKVIADIGFNGFLINKTNLNLPSKYDFLKLDYSKSLFFSFSILNEGFKILENHITLNTGLTFEFNNYAFVNNYKLSPDSNFIYATKTTNVKYKKDKLVVSYLDIPLILKFETIKDKRNNTYYISAGIIGGLRIDSHTKQVFKIGNEKDKPKIHDDFNLAPFKYSGIIKLGYGDYSIYGTYTFSNLFRKNEGPTLNPFSIGFSWDF